MNRLEVLKEEISKLSTAEFAELRNWLLERDWEEWDRQIERDSASGKLDRLFEEAHENHRQGKSTKFLNHYASLLEHRAAHVGVLRSDRRRLGG